MSLLIRGGEVLGAGGRSLLRADVRVSGGAILEVAPALRPRPGEEIIDAGGGAVIPGLHDHHVHIRAAAAARASVDVGPPAVTSVEEFGRRIRVAVDAAPPPTGGSAAPAWVRAVGYHESVAGPLDRWALDRLSPPGVAVRVQHRSGELWVLNSAALEAVDPVGGLGSAPAGAERDCAGVPTGQFWREDRWLREQVPPVESDLAAVGAAAAALGITGFTDATPDQATSDLDSLIYASEDGLLRQRLCLMAPSAARLRPSPLVALGPVKVLLDDTTLPSLPELVGIVDAAHRESRAVAVHCVTHVQTVLAVAALETAGGGAGGGTDRIEHGALLSPDLAGSIRELGTTVITQPAFVHSRGDQYLDTVDPGDQADLWRLRSLLDVGVAVAGSSDAPFGPMDPWLAIRASVSRQTSGGRVLGLSERLSCIAALRLWLGRPDRPSVPRAVTPGQPADLCVLAHPLSSALQEPCAPTVLATVVAGRVIYRSV